MEGCGRWDNVLIFLVLVEEWTCLEERKNNGMVERKEEGGVERDDWGKEQKPLYLIWVNLTLKSIGLIDDQQSSLDKLSSISNWYENWHILLLHWKKNGI